MTLAQLQSFVLVARHGSVKAAAAELEVTEPAVSVAVSALKRELGDELFVRSGRGIALTPGGRRLAALATEILGLAEQARRSVAASGELRRLSVLATPLVAEHIGPMIELFSARDDALEITVATEAAGSFAEALEHRRADIALGPAPGAGATVGRLRPVPALPLHPRRRARRTRSRAERAIAPAALAGERWLVGPPELDRGEATGSFLARHGLAPEDGRDLLQRGRRGRRRGRRRGDHARPVARGRRGGQTAQPRAT